MRMRKFESIEDAKIVAEKVLDSIRDRLNKIIRSRVEKEELFRDEGYKGVGAYSHGWIKAEIMQLAETWGFGAWPECTEREAGGRLDIVWYADCSGKWEPIVVWEIDKERPAEYSRKKLLASVAPIGVQIFLKDCKIEFVNKRGVEEIIEQKAVERKVDDKKEKENKPLWMVTLPDETIKAIENIHRNTKNRLERRKRTREKDGGV